MRKRIKKTLRLSGRVWMKDLNDVIKPLLNYLLYIINMHDESTMISNKLLAERDSNEFLNKTHIFSDFNCWQYIISVRR